MNEGERLRFLHFMEVVVERERDYLLMRKVPILASTGIRCDLSTTHFAGITQCLRSGVASKIDIVCWRVAELRNLGFRAVVDVTDDDDIVAAIDPEACDHPECGDIVIETASDIVNGRMVSL